VNTGYLVLACSASAVAVLGGVAGLCGLLLRIGRREGKIDAVLERLTEIAEDHEDRIRANERGTVADFLTPRSRARPPGRS
jgi:hypothetical protein